MSQKNNFIYQLQNFEEIFEKQLTPNEENSVDVFFAQVSKDFISKLQKQEKVIRINWL